MPEGNKPILAFQTSTAVGRNALDYEAELLSRDRFEGIRAHFF
jgi:hypothetical protein